MRRPDAPTRIIEFTPGMRVLIEDAIEAPILLLDVIDGDADLECEPDDEDGDDLELSLGWSHPCNRQLWGLDERDPADC
jgi:hypothetical protein